MIQKCLFLLALLFITNTTVAQTEKYTLAITNFQDYYNTEKYEEIFNCFAPEMKQALPLESTKQFFKELQNQVGKLESKQYINSQQSYAIYKSKFERATLAINISLNNQSQINGLLIKAYTEPQISKTINTLDNYPEEIAKIIFSKAQNFPNHAQLAIAIVENNNTNYYGVIKHNDTIKPIHNNDNIFEIGSITKVFTSTVLAGLVQNKKVKLNEPINKYYPFKFKNNIKMINTAIINFLFTIYNDFKFF